MDKLDHRQLTLIKRAAEDAIHACNRHYGPFVDVVAHPLNIIALVEMAQSRQPELVDKDQRIHELNETSLDLEGQIYKLQEQLNEKDKRIETALNHLNDVRNKGMDQSCYLAIKALRDNNANS